MEKELEELKQSIQRQEKHIRELEDKYNKLVNSLMPDFIFVFDTEMVFHDIILPAGMSLLHPREELLGTSGRAIFTPEVCDLYISNIRDCLATGQMREIEYYLAMGEVKYYFQARIVPYGTETVSCLIRDIGDRVRRMDELMAARKKAEDADRMKSAFLANMSHEIRTPLNAIVGFAEVLSVENDPEAREQYMEVVRTNNNLLLQLINDILDLSRIESGKYEMHFEQINAPTLLEEVELTCRMKMKPGVELKVVSPDRDITVLTDHNRITQVLYNFFSNAIKNTDIGSITIMLEEIEGYLRFSVADTGRGIPADRLPTIFNRFEKVNEFVQGTGLGLSICQSIIQRLGGEIWVTSTEGQGSTFYFTIPHRSITPQDAEEAAGNASSRKKIVVGEDYEVAASLIRSVLGADYEVLISSRGEEAVNLAIQHRPAMVLLDMQLPDINGIDAVKKIRSVLQTVPIIALTSGSYYMERQWALENGCNDIIPKPLTESKIREIVLAFI